MAALKLTRSRDGVKRANITVQHRIGSRDIATALFTHPDSVSVTPTRTAVLNLVREVAARKGELGLAPECGVDIDEGYEAAFARDARRAVATVRRLWPELDDADLAEFEKDYAMPGVDLDTDIEDPEQA